MLRVVVADTNVFINLAHAQLMGKLAELQDLEFVIPDAVRAEVKYPSQIQVIDAAIDDGTLREVRLENIDGLADYASLSQQIGKGEAVCLALATLNPDWILASDERRIFRRIALERLGEARIVTTPWIILHMIKLGTLTVQQADHAKAILEKHRFTMTFASFAEILDRER